jgi:DNA-binding SARP family transcriptional activator
VLAALLLHPGQVVSVDRLVDTLWEEAPPRSAASNIRTYVADLRASLGSLRVVSHPSGYLIQTGPAELDLLLFEALAKQGEKAAKDGDALGAARSLEQAAGLWRGRPLTGVELGSWGKSRITLLDDRRWGVLSALAEAEMALGRYEGLIVRLRRMLEERPLCERTWAQLMVALSRVGRKAEALLAFAQAREILTRELGLEPCPELREVQGGILAGREALPWSGHQYVRAGSVRGTALPHYLPMAKPGFVGRTAELAELTGVLSGRSADRDGESGVAAISGSPGVGKTVLLLRAAHELAPRFPDGCLYQVLDGSTGRPKAASVVLREFLRSMGIPPERVPIRVEEQATLYRSLLADRRMLIVLDDVADAAQLRPLLPGAGDCRALVASRTTLTPLDAARPVRVGPLDEEHSIDLLRRVIGDDRVAREPGQARRIAVACAGLPLALWIAGTRLAVRPSWPLARLAERLADDAGRLRELAIGELSVQAAFASSYVRLSPGARRVLRLAATLSPAFLPAPALRSQGGADRAAPRGGDGAVEELILANLLIPDRSGYRVDDLLRLYVRGRAETGDPPDWPLQRLVRSRQAIDGTARAGAGNQGEADNDV